MRTLRLSHLGPGMSPSAKKPARKKKSVAKKSAAKRTKKQAAPKPSPSIGDYLRAQRNLADKSVRKVAEQAGIPTSVLSEIERGIRVPSQAILGSLAGALRLSADTLNLQAGVLDPQDADEASVVLEIQRDPHLTDRQADILIDIYRTFRALEDEEY